jgi:signal transduction histidine kinase
MRWIRSIRFKLAAVITLIVAISLVTQMGVSTFRTARQQRAQAIERAKGQAELAAEPIVETYLKNKDALGLDLVKAMRQVAQRTSSLEYFQIIDTKGVVAFDSRSLKRAVVKETITDKDQLNAIQASRNSQQQGASSYMFVIPYFNEAGSHNYTVRSFVSFSDIGATTRANAIQLLILLIIILPVVFILVVLFVHNHILKPIDRIRATSNAVAGGDYDERINLRTHDEFSLLSQNVNHMIEILGTSIKGLEEEKAWKNEFLVLASHNLRTPLTVIMSSVSSLRKEGKVSQSAQRYLDYIASRGKELHALIENMLSISMLKGGKLQKTEEPFDIIPLAEQIVKDQEPRLEEKHVELILDTNVKHAIINGDENLIFQVLDNLLDNAIKYTPEKGKIVLSVQDTKQDIVISVKDSGDGIEQDMINKLFQSFHRGSNPMSVDHKGAGLGLYFVKLAVEAHEGEVSIKSKQGQGTEVSFRLPKHTS